MREKSRQRRARRRFASGGKYPDDHSLILGEARRARRENWSAAAAGIIRYLLRP